jgi:hypothetical protein
MLGKMESDVQNFDFYLFFATWQQEHTLCCILFYWWIKTKLSKTKSLCSAWFWTSKSRHFYSLLTRISKCRLFSINFYISHDNLLSKRSIETIACQPSYRLFCVWITWSSSTSVGIAFLLQDCKSIWRLLKS